MLIQQYKVKSPLLQNYIKFFWVLSTDDYVEINHKFLPQRDINIRINLSDTPHNIISNNQRDTIEELYFLGLQNKFTNSYLKYGGKVNVMGICFQPFGLYPFLKKPLSEFRNNICSADQIGSDFLSEITYKLKEADTINKRLKILERELTTLYGAVFQIPENFRSVFNYLIQNNSLSISEFCRINSISTRKLERQYNKYIGVSANTYNTLNRFHLSLKRVIKSDYTKLSDLAYDYNYYDQMHFIRDFKRFTGNTPRDFLNQKNSLLNIGKFM